MHEKIRKNLTRGFTLVELMIVVAIIAILATIATPTLTDSMRRNRSRNSASDVASVLRNARTQAMSRGEIVLVQINPNDRNQMMVMSAAPNVVPGNAATPVATSCRLINNFAAAVTQPHDNIPPRIFEADELIRGDVNVMPIPGVLAGPRILCFSPTGRVYDDTGNLVSGDYAGCQRGFIIALGQLPQSTNILSFNATYFGGGGGYNLICGQSAVGGDSLGEATSDTLRTERNKLRLAREEGYVYIVEVTSSGSIVVQQ